MEATITDNKLTNSDADLWLPSFHGILDDLLSLCCFFRSSSVANEGLYFWQKEPVTVKIDVSSKISEI